MLIVISLLIMFVDYLLFSLNNYKFTIFFFIMVSIQCYQMLKINMEGLKVNHRTDNYYFKIYIDLRFF